MRIEGRAFRLPPELRDDVNTDVIIPGRYLRLPEDELSQHAFEGTLPDFAGQVSERPVLIAGRNMGSGSSREQAPKALLGSGIRLIVAHSVGRIFLRNAINLGLPVLELPDVFDLVSTDDWVEADLERGTLSRAGVVVAELSVPDHLVKILAAGGILPLLKHHPDALS